MVQFTKLLVVVLLTSVFAVKAEVQVGGGNSSGRGGVPTLTGCADVSSMIVQRWLSVKQIMVPAHEKNVKRPKANDFYCANANYLRNRGFERNLPQSDLRCYSDPEGNGRGACCDQQLSACVQLSWEMLPNTLAKLQARKQKEYKPSDSNWVRPPSDSEQWTPAKSGNN